MTAIFLAAILTISHGGQSVGGKATWYDATKNNAWYTRAPWDLEFYAAVGPKIRALKGFKWRQPWRIMIRSLATGKAKIVWVTDWCQCRENSNNEKLVDLSPALWQWLCECSLSRGVQQVQVTLLP